MAITRDRDVLAANRLHIDVVNDPPIIVVHASAIRIKNTHDLNIQIVLAVIIKKQSFSAALAFVITGTLCDGI